MLDPAFGRVSDTWHQIHAVNSERMEIERVKVVCAGGEVQKEKTSAPWGIRPTMGNSTDSARERCGFDRTQ